MKLFLSWSGPTSKAVSLVLRDWLPQVINEIEPFMSSEDIEKGARGLDVIASELQDTAYGIVVVTKDNFERPWINFEAGALSKHIGRSHLTPLLFRVEYSQITGPLTQFQHVLPVRDEMRKLMHGINRACERPMDAVRLDKSFGKWWDELSSDLEAVRTPVSPEKPRRDPDDVLAEVLQVVRGLQRDAATRAFTPGGEAADMPTLRLSISYTGESHEHDARFVQIVESLEEKYGLIPERVEDANTPIFSFFNVSRELRKVISQYIEEEFQEGDGEVMFTLTPVTGW